MKGPLIYTAVCLGGTIYVGVSGAPWYIVALMAMNLMVAVMLVIQRALGVGP